jgi:hypothetical protein
MKVTARTPRQSTSAQKFSRKAASQRISGRAASVKSTNSSGVCHALEQASASLRGLQNIPDCFQLNSLVAQILFVELHEHAEAQYGQGRSKSLSLQTGQGQISFSKLFEPLSAIDLVRLFENLLRFASYESYASARAYFLTYAALSFEHDASGEYIGPGVWTSESDSRTAVLRVRRTLKRWCDWLEALTHFQVHQAHQPASQLLALDKAIIFLWPLLQKHQWSQGELLKVLQALSYSCGSSSYQFAGASGRAGNPPPAAKIVSCPFVAAEQLATYCRSSLGLHCERTTAASGPVTSLAGYAVAERFVRFLPTIC